MALTPGLSPSIRLVQPDPEFEGMGEDSTVEIIEGDDKEIANEDGKVLEIEHDDGSITISLDGKSLTGEDEAKGPTGWFDNLVDDIPELELNRISDELLRGISDDIDSRKDWIEDHSTGIKLLGLKIEIPGLGGSAEGAPVEGMNRVRHPLLLEAVLRAAGPGVPIGQGGES